MPSRASYFSLGNRTLLPRSFKLVVTGQPAPYTVIQTISNQPDNRLLDLRAHAHFPQRIPVLLDHLSQLRSRRAAAHHEPPNHLNAKHVLRYPWIGHVDASVSSISTGFD